MQASDLTLADEIGKYYDDPYGFVLFAYDWGHGDLKGFEGPDKWQKEFLQSWGEQISDRKFNGVDAVDPIQFSTTSGHGVGKSALTAWIVNFIASTRPFCKGVVTANTSPQLRTKTWAEVQKWTKRLINAHWFKVTSGMHMKLCHVDHPDTWRVDAQTCAKENSEAFAGLHAANSTPFYIFDEASAIDQTIWEVAEGGLTDGEPMIFAFGNPTRGSGGFHATFNRQKHRWTQYRVDSRNVQITNKKKIQEWIDDYGEDSDFVRVRVRGEFPRAGSCQFISTEDVDKCRRYKCDPEPSMPVLIGVDVARFGDDQSVIYVRQGRYFHEMKTYRGLELMALASMVIEMIEKYRPHGVMVDGGGVGGGVVDRLNQLGYNVIEVGFGEHANDKKAYANKRAEMWGDMRSALKAGMMLPDNSDLCDELTAVEYGFTGKQQILLEKKEDMKKRGLASPDCADAIALTFAEKVIVGNDYHEEEDYYDEETWG